MSARAEEAGSTGRQESGQRLARSLLRLAMYSAASALILFFVFPRGELTVRLFREQDFAALLLGAGALAALALSRLPPMTLKLPRPALVISLLAVGAAVAAWAGSWLVFGGYTLTRDEILADFDAASIARGFLIGPLPSEWSGFSGALMPRFMLPIPADAGWLSAYLPGNAALRALGALTVGVEWTNPILAAVAILALYRIGRRLWPETPRLAFVPALLLASSAQVLTMAMTAYAMTAHLTFNLLWLWSFLRNDRKGDVAAFAAGFVATGLHQLLFHPLFVLPFIIHLWRSGDKRRAAAYVAAYAAIGLFWAFYWQILLTGAGAAGEQASATGLSYLVVRFLDLLASIEASAGYVMAFNLMRFLSWQNILLLPLALLAWPALAPGDGIARPLAAGIVLTIVAMFVLLPWQAHGWGYRYVHGLIGSLCLLAGYGWNSLAAGEGGRRRATVLALATAASLLVILPLHLKHVHDLVAPYREAYATITRSPADVVLVDDRGLLYAEDLIRNAPDLSNRPKILAVKFLSDAQLAHLCARYRIESFDTRHGRLAGIPDQRSGGEPPHPRRPLLDRLGCAPPMRFDSIRSATSRRSAES